MLRLFAAGVGGVLLSVVLISGQSSVSAADKTVPDIEAIMKKINKPNRDRQDGQGKTMHKVVGKALEEETIDWGEVAKMSKEYAELAGYLGQNKCPKGSADSWAKLCKAYAEDAKALDTAAGKRDKAAATAAWGKLNKSCQSCHEEHR